MKSALFVLAVAASFSCHILAAQESGTILIAGQIAGACTVSTTPTVTFGAMQAGETKTVTSAVSVTCGSGTAYTVRPHNSSTLSVGGTKNGLLMNQSVSIAGASTVSVGIGSVALFRDAGATLPWSDAARISGIGTGTATTHDIALKFSHDEQNYGNFGFTLRPTVEF